MKKTILIIFFNLAILIFVADNLLYHFIIRGENLLSITFRHAHSSNHKDRPSELYIKKSNNSLRKEVVKFRTGKDGSILPDGGNTLGINNCTAVFIGGSSTENRWINEENRWPSMVGNLLLQKGFNIRTKNYGVGGQNLHQSTLRYISFIEEIRPDYVFVMHEANDISKFIKGGYYVKESSLHNSYDSVNTKSNLLSRIKKIFSNSLPFIDQKIRQIRNKRSMPSKRKDSLTFQGLAAEDAAIEYFSRVKIIDSILETRNAKIILIQYPQVYREILLGDDFMNSNVKDNLIRELKNNGLSAQRFIEYVEDFRAKLNFLAKENNISVVYFEKEDFNQSMFYDAVHLNEYGTEEFSILLSEKISSLISCK